VTGAELEQAFIDRWKHAPLLLALSGGGDSVALLHLLADSRLNFRAVIIDHALREGSAEDAHRAQRVALERGVQAEIATLSWSDTEARSQENARRKRYAALSAEARKHGAAILTGHTADDQAETVLMRAKAGSGWRGLAGMAADTSAPVWPEGRGVRLLRPLLHARRTDLRAYLSARSAAWIEDPANTNERFERVRIRAELAELERSGLDPMRLVRTAACLRKLVSGVDAEARALIASAAVFDAGAIRVKRTAWRARVEVRERALGVLLAAAAGAESLADADAIERLEARCFAEDFRGATLGGAELSVSRGDLVLNRDPGALLGRAGAAPLAELSLPAEIETIWDGRLALTAREQGWRVAIDRHARPILRTAETMLPLAAAIAEGVVSATWLTEAAVLHRLGGENPPTPSISVR
jgi:tRNA(Ile)-lysidine synthase